MDKESVQPLEELLDSVRDIDGFPIAKDEDILALSDPPFYTACPNPYIKDFIDEYGTPYNADNDDYDKKPFLGDIRGGRDSIYMAHTYHTKVPHKPISDFIKHYTEKGDLVFDGFCGSGMTGVAAQMAERNVILSEISPAATFITQNYNYLLNNDFHKNATKILDETKEECAWMYKTLHKEGTLIDNENYGLINYIIWSDILICPYCGNEYVFWEKGVDQKKYALLKKFVCDSCDSKISKDECEHAHFTFFDNIINKEVTQNKQIPVLINYSYHGKKFNKKPDEYDIKLIDKINHLDIPYYVPNDFIMSKGEGWGDSWRKGYHFGITNVNHFFTKRNLWILSELWEKATDNSLKFLITSFMIKTGSKLHNIGFKKGKLNLAGQVSGTLYIPSLQAERNIFNIAERKLKDINSAIQKLKRQRCIISTQSTTNLSNIPDNSIDYVFIDPPFGSNLMYSELSFIWESWLKVKTNITKEAIKNDSQKKGLNEYTELMSDCFVEINRVLKPNHWITVEFHNSQASVWNSIQEAMNRAGFIIAQVAVFDKGQGTFKQQTAPNTVENDLIINAYKPKEEFTQRFLQKAGESMEIDFVVQQLEHLPVTPNIERTEKMLFSKMLAHYVENGFRIKYNANNFYKLLSDNLIEMDGYWFLESQVKEYNQWKSSLSLDELKETLDGQLQFLITDERAAITWIYNFLNKPMEYGKIFTAYQQITQDINDNIPELRDILEKNFIIEKGKYRRPLDQKEREEINKSRERELERAFNKLLEQAKTKKGKIKEVHHEALIHGFTKCYQEGKYSDILVIADKLYPNTKESSGEIMDFIDIAHIKTSGQEKL